MVLRRLLRKRWVLGVVFGLSLIYFLTSTFKQVLERFLNRAAVGFQNLFTAVEDHFELCLAKCRTSSQLPEEHTVASKPAEMSEGCGKKNYTPTVVHMENMAGGSDIKSENAAKSKGVVQEIKTEKFVCFLHFMLDYSTILSKCCTDFQHDNLNITRTNQLVESTTSRLLSLKTKPGEYQKTLDTKFTANEDGSICYCGTRLTKCQRPRHLWCKDSEDY
ncbi:CL049 protein, partial [Polypterus senegalus]